MAPQEIWLFKRLAEIMEPLEVSGDGRHRRPEKFAIFGVLCIISKGKSEPKHSKFSLRRKMIALVYELGRAEGAENFVFDHFQGVKSRRRRAIFFAILNRILVISRR